jgi:hypothetical protein
VVGLVGTQLIHVPSMRHFTPERTDTLSLPAL